MTPFWNWMQKQIDILIPKTRSEGYCMRCRAPKLFTVVEDKILKSGRRALQGMCPDCGTKISKLVAI